MLVIGHRGAAGSAPENTIDSLRVGLDAGADILEFDVRLTKDKVPVLVHDFHTVRTHRDASIIGRMTLAELQQKFTKRPFTLLSTVLDEMFGVVVLNIELKGRGTGKVVSELLESQYIKKDSDWDNVLFSSFKATELYALRRASKSANLALLHSQNPFIFIAYHRQLHLSAVGFHRLYLNSFALEIAKKAKLFTYVYTVNRPKTALMLAQQGIDGVVTDDPDSILSEIKKQASTKKK